MNPNRHGRYARTLEEAFGPGQRGGLWIEPDPMHPHDKIVLIACGAALAFLAWVLL